ncbi:hypothetical protein Bca52824_015909 [Brassica carinata]|uniref:Uncharacterized protein n=1 Tax=Brassica carinata TaxID=52824 RepID=A0A8X7W3H7_BRACI|nr:hypothetical protein Bca52824_015909 [Brassica carinata]
MIRVQTTWQHLIGSDLSSDGDAIAFLHLIDDGLSPPRAQADGFHYRQPWVIGLREEIKRRLNGWRRLSSDQRVKVLTVQVDNLHVQVTDMEKMEWLSKRLEEAEEVDNLTAMSKPEKLAQ